MKREPSQICSVASVAVRVYTESRNRNPAGGRGSVQIGFPRAHISAYEISVQILPRASSPSAKQDHVLHTARWDWFLISERLSWSNLALLLCRWNVAFRSFREHIRIQSATSGGRVDLGPAFQLQDGYDVTNARTIARAEGIKRLLAIHPWCDSVDLRIFLMGFDAGEGYCMAIPLPDGDKPESHNTQTKTAQ